MAEKPTYQELEERIRHLEQNELILKQTQEVLNENQRQLTTLLSNLPGMVYRCQNNQQWSLEFVSNGCYPLTGYQPEDLIADARISYADLIHVDDRQMVYDTVQKALAEDRPFQVDYRITTAAGEGKWVWEQGRHIRDKQGNPIAIEGFIADITRPKQAEIELQKLSIQKQLALDAARMGWWHYDPITKIASWDDGYKEIFRVTGYQMPNDEILSRLHPEDLPGVWANVEAALDPIDPKPYKAEYRINLPGGSMKWVEAHGITTFEGNGANRRATSLVGTVADITERKLAGEMLATSERNYRELIETANSIIIRWDGTGVIRFVNEYGLGFFGYSKEEVIDRDIFNILQKAESSLEQDLSTFVRGIVSYPEKYVSIQGKHFRKDHMAVWVTWTHKAMLDEEGKVREILTIGNDITELKEAETALRQSEERWSVTLGSIGDAVITTDMDGRVTFLNSVAEALTGWQTVEATGKPVQDVFRIVNEYTRKVVDDPVKKVLQTGYIVGLANHTVLLRRDSSEVPIDDSGAPIRDRKGNIIGVVLVFRDITERKQAEEALHKSETLLKEIQALTKTGGWELDVSTGHLSWTDEMYRIYGVKAEEYKPGDISRDLDFYAPDAIPLLRQAFDRALDQGEPYDLDLELIQASGKRIWVRTMGIPVLEKSKIVRITGNLIDITDRIKIEEQLRQAQKMESVGRLAGGVAHDFNNMLGAILGYAELAIGKLDPSQPIYSHLEEILKAAERSSGLTRQLLAFARKQTISPKVLDLNEIVSGMLKMLQHLIGENIHLTWLPGTDIWPVRIDPSQIDQILANLCVNARDAIADIGRITIETQNIVLDKAYYESHPGFLPGEYVKMTVSDDGCGMDGETLSHIFEPFFTTKGVGKGTGLGLATVYGIVKQNNGFINAYSEPGSGTSFTIYLPRHIDKPHEMQTTSFADPESRGEETILLVEDEPALLRMSAMMLDDQGYTVLAAGTPGEAISLAREYTGNIHLLITDIIMPEMNGRDLAKNILSLYPDIKRLFMSGYTSNVVAHHGVLDPGINFIQKPFSAKNLSAKVRQVLSNESSDHE